MKDSEGYSIKNISLLYKKTEPGEIVFASMVISCGIILSVWLSYLGAALSVLGIWIFIKHFLGQSTFASPFLPAHNVKTDLFTFQGTAKKKILLLLPESFYKPKYRYEKFYTNFLFFYTIVSGLTIFWLYSKDLMPDKRLFFFGTAFLLLVQISFLIIYLCFQKRLYGKAVQSAEVIDFFSMVKVPTNLQVLIKPNLKGVSYLTNFIQEQNQELCQQDSYIINVSKFLSEKFTFFSEEGVIILKEYDKNIPGKVKEFDFHIKQNKSYISDLIAFTNEGYSGISVSLGNNQQENHDILFEVLKQCSSG